MGVTSTAINFIRSIAAEMQDSARQPVSQEDLTSPSLIATLGFSQPHFGATVHVQLKTLDSPQQQHLPAGSFAFV